MSKEDASRALQGPAQQEGGAFSQKALNKIYVLTKGYPYFLQEWGYQAWNHALKSPISEKTIIDVTKLVVERLDENFFRVRFDRVTPREKRFLRAMAELGKGPYNTGDIATVLGVSINTIAPPRASLIQKGMVYSPAYGKLDFTVPLFDAFMLRMM